MECLLNDRARQLRKNATDAENRMWYFLRNRRLNGLKFNRQYIIEPYIVDFVCRDKNLIIEIDGAQHAENIEYDLERTSFLKSNGYKVLRFWNNEVMHNINAVLELILSSSEPSPALRAPSPSSGRGDLKQ
jgi:very-short-patch-repair endonuclease